MVAEEGHNLANKPQFMHVEAHVAYCGGILARFQKFFLLGSCFFFHPLIGPEPNGRAGAKKQKHAAGCQSSPKRKKASQEGFEPGTLRFTELRTTT